MIKRILNIVAMTLIIGTLPTQAMNLPDIDDLSFDGWIRASNNGHNPWIEKPHDYGYTAALLASSAAGAYLVFKVSKMVPHFIKKKEYIKAAAFYGACVIAGTIFLRATQKISLPLPVESAVSMLGLGLLLFPILETLADDEVFADTTVHSE